MMFMLAEISIQLRRLDWKMIKPYSIFSNALSSASWDDIVNDHDVHHSYRKFINVFFGNL